MKLLIAGKQDLTLNYVSAFHSLGAESSVWLPDCSESFLSPVHKHAEDFQGLILPGGGDIHPAYFGQQNTGSLSIDSTLDLAQFSLLGAFLRAGKPILGICRGMQLINVAFGGDLIQDLDHQIRPLHAWCGQDATHCTTILPDTFLSDLYGSQLVTNSAHHQAVDNLGVDLLPAAYGPGHVLEALYHRRLPVLGVQWHPERMCGAQKNPEAGDGSQLLLYFISLCSS